jgi:hypothetical protein
MIMDVQNSKMVMDYCTVPEYKCFVDNDCRQCLSTLIAAVHDGSDTKVNALRSPACVATSRSLLNDLANQCEPFPTCTFYKNECTSSPECSLCMATVHVGDGEGAARQCPVSTRPSAVAVNNVVNFCTDNNAAACDFWHQRCADDVNCSACLADMQGNVDSTREIAADWSTAACRRTLQDSVAVSYLNAMTSGCPDISACRLAISNCIIYNGDVCISCLNGSAPPDKLTTSCSQLLQQFSYDTACQPCPAAVHTINAVVIATAAVGGTSAAACIAVVATIVAHGRDRVSMRDRIVVGLMMANAVYSTANTIPLNGLSTDVLDCGRMVMSFDAIRFGQAWWFCGKYGLVAFEVFILGASIRALCRGVSVMPPCVEAAIHGACCAMALLAFAVFYTMCAKINADGYNTMTESEEYTNSYNHVSPNDDLDDNEPSIAASVHFKRGRDDYDKLVRDMLIAWSVLGGVVIFLWAVLRMLYRHALRELQIEAAATARAEAADVWVKTRRSAWEARRCLLEARREAFNEVAKPLEPYIAVFVIFFAPAFVMSTSFCRDNSGSSAGGTSSTVGGSGTTTTLTYGTCDVWCEFVLAFRSLSTVAVYMLMSRERRAELFNVRVTMRKLFVRVAGCFRRSTASYTLLDHDHGREEFEMHTVGQGSDTTATALSDRSRHISEHDIEKVQVIGRGGFGEVWEGILQPDGQRVAIKVMLAAAVDDDGDVIDPYADEDFRKECDVLQRIDSPHLLKFFGFGTTVSGRRFIVTELLAGGSLLDVLRDPQRNLPWRTRAKIALQVALGMKHLHERHMLHRDLKSANVLLDEQLRAKVCDFGLSRIVRPARQRVVHSPFTGVTQLLPQVDGVEINDVHSVLSFEDIAVNVLDARGTMTKAAGTLLWMAPEVFRGDRNYTGAVDVYSYGIMMWELATRKKTWVDELSHETFFFEQLNRALQTGRRPAIPDEVVAEHGEFVALMQRCWAGDPADRPSFAEVSTDLFFFLFKE